MQIYIMNIYVDDQQVALDFYTEKLGFIKKHDLHLGKDRWLTVVSKTDQNGIELLLEPSSHLAIPAYKEALKADSIPAASFKVNNLSDEYLRLLNAGVVFTQKPLQIGNVTTAILDDTCGNLIQLIQM